MKENHSPQENEALFNRRTFLKGLLLAGALIKTGNAEALMDSFENDIENTLKTDETSMAPLLQNKYHLPQEAWKAVIEKTQKDLLGSEDAKEAYKNGGKPALERYAGFRIELNAINASEFSVSEIHENPFYQNVFQNLSKKGIPPDKIQTVLADERLKKTNIKPLYFYCRPHSAQEQSKENTIPAEELFGLDIKIFRFTYSKWLEEAEKKFGVNKEIIIAILKVESNLGLRILDFSAVEVLNSIISRYFIDPIAPRDAKEKMKKRADTIKTMAAQNLTALLHYAFTNKMDPFSIKSNLVGAVGLPQFMPTNVEHYGVDADQNGTLDLETMPDAILSIGRFLKGAGWGKTYDLNHLTPEETQKIIKTLLIYNQSKAYGKTILELAKKIQQENGN